MKTVLHRAETRGYANHGWLKSYHTFSFANYYHPDRLQFGALRVLNDDTVSASMGFGTHPHRNMEIISLPLSGDLEHRDSMGNKSIIKEGDIQVMSAGSGIEHSEKNRNTDKEVQFLQIWLLPNAHNVKPRYDQLTLNAWERENRWQQVLSPKPDDDGVWVHQDAWFHLTKLHAGKSLDYTVKKEGNGLYYFVLEGEIEVDGQQLRKRDGLGLWEVKMSTSRAISNADVLLMEVPMG